jgi:hypothetical protein
MIPQHLADDRHALATFRCATQRLIDSGDGAVTGLGSTADLTVREAIAKANIHDGPDLTLNAAVPKRRTGATIAKPALVANENVSH